MDPTVADRQFDLASYFHDRGWLESELDVLGRVRELGLDEQSRIIDYREGLNVDTDPERPTISQTRLLVDVSLNTLWQGPIKGRDVVEHMLLHSLYHQPAFEGEAVDRSPGSDTPLSLLMRERDVDGAIEVDIERWDDAFEATIVLHLPANRVEESTFYARGRMKPWRLNHELVSLLKSRWPWKGSIYREEPGGAWVNLGRVHGLETGDDFDLGDRALEAGEVLENRLRLDYPTPALQGKIDRGTTVQLQNPGNNEE